jgi:hypothetical protein
MKTRTCRAQARVAALGRRGLVFVALAVALAACAKRGDENVTARFEGSHIVIENRSGEDVHAQLAQGRGAWVPISTPNNRLADGQSLRARVAPSDRGQAVELVWWRPGKKIADSEMRGPDRLRRVKIELPPLTEPLADDEMLIRTCLALGNERVAEYRERRPSRYGPGEPPPAVSEMKCVEMAERDCPKGRCIQELRVLQAQLEFVRDLRQRNQEKPEVSSPARASAGGPSLVHVTERAFHELASGYIDDYVARLCPSLRDIYAGKFMRGQLRKQGDGFRSRGILLGKVSKVEELAVTMDAVDHDMLERRKPVIPPLAIKATFKIADDDRPCLIDIEQVR